MSKTSSFTAPIVLGQRCHCILYGGRDGIVVDIHGEQSPETCKSLGGGVGVMGGNAHFDIIWENGTQSPHIPESLMRSSVQWEVFPEVATAEEIAAARTHLAIETARQTTEAEAAAKAFRAECDKLRASHPKLAQASPESNSFKCAIGNIRVLLKELFPKVKFSVKTEYYGSIRIAWTDGPTGEQVDQIVDQFQEGHFDGMEDIYKYSETPWTAVFGGAKYISTSRSFSDELLLFALDKLYEQLPVNLENTPKPNIEVLRNYGYCPKIPSLDMNVNEGAQAIATCYDKTDCKFVMNGFHRHSWLIEPLIEAQAAPQAEAVCA